MQYRFVIIHEWPHGYSPTIMPLHDFKTREDAEEWAKGLQNAETEESHRYTVFDLSTVDLDRR